LSLLESRHFRDSARVNEFETSGHGI
jgi:hypothetical protein